MSPKMLNNWQPSSRQRRACSESRDSVPHALPAFLRGGADALQCVDALGVQEFARHAQRHRQIGRPDEQPIDALRRRDLVDDLHRFRRFNLNRHPAIAVGASATCVAMSIVPKSASTLPPKKPRMPTGGYLAHSTACFTSSSVRTCAIITPLQPASIGRMTVA